MALGSFLPGAAAQEAVDASEVVARHPCGAALDEYEARVVGRREKPARVAREKPGAGDVAVRRQLEICSISPRRDYRLESILESPKNLRPRIFSGGSLWAFQRPGLPTHDSRVPALARCF